MATGFLKGWIAYLFFEKTRRGVSENVDRGAKIVDKVVDKASEVVQPLTESVRDIAGAVAARIRINQKEVNAIRDRAQRLAEEVQNLRSKRIEVTQIVPVLQLALTQVNFSYFDFYKQIVKETPSTFGRDEKYEVLLATRVNYSQSLGVDIAKLWFQITGPSTILVSGLGITKVGTNDLSITPLHSELRVHKGKSKLLPDSNEIVGDVEGHLIREKDARLQAILLEVIRRLVPACR